MFEFEKREQRIRRKIQIFPKREGESGGGERQTLGRRGMIKIIIIMIKTEAVGRKI